MGFLRCFKNATYLVRTSLVVIVVLLTAFLLLIDYHDWHFAPLLRPTMASNGSSQVDQEAGVISSFRLKVGTSDEHEPGRAKAEEIRKATLRDSLPKPTKLSSVTLHRSDSENATFQAQNSPSNSSLPEKGLSANGSRSASPLPTSDSADRPVAERSSSVGNASNSAVSPRDTSPNPPPMLKTHTVEKHTLSLRRVEASLRHARASLRRAILSERNKTLKALANRTEEEDEPSGLAYRNATIFRQSYFEMEKRFKVFVYAEGEEPLVHNGPCKEIYAVEGRFIQELQGRNPFVTRDPEKAHAFFLPFSVVMMVNYLHAPKSRDMSPLLHFVRDYVDVVGSKYPYWNRSGGADHFMLSCHDWGPHVSTAHPDLSRNAIRVLCNSNLSEGYVPIKDVSLPEINLHGGIIPTELGGPDAAERTNLAFFAGKDHGPVRPVLFRHWEGKDARVRVFQMLPSEYSYHEFMKQSKFCLCPGGYEVNSPRIVEAIYSDCVPVIIADNFVLPFSDVLDWEAFSLHIKEADIANLKNILLGVSMERYEQMQRRVRQVKRHFILNQPPQKYDAFHMILHSVWLRRLNLRIAHPPWHS